MVLLNDCGIGWKVSLVILWEQDDSVIVGFRKWLCSCRIRFVGMVIGCGTRLSGMGSSIVRGGWRECFRYISFPPWRPRLVSLWTTSLGCKWPLSSLSIIFLCNSEGWPDSFGVVVDVCGNGNAILWQRRLDDYAIVEDWKRGEGNHWDFIDISGSDDF